MIKLITNNLRNTICRELVELKKKKVPYAVY